MILQSSSPCIPLQRGKKKPNISLLRDGWIMGEEELLLPLKIRIDCFPLRRGIKGEESYYCLSK
jgi:hypothetical protein